MARRATLMVQHPSWCLSLSKIATKGGLEVVEVEKVAVICEMLVRPAFVEPRPGVDAKKDEARGGQKFICHSLVRARKEVNRPRVD